MIRVTPASRELSELTDFEVMERRAIKGTAKRTEIRELLRVYAPLLDGKLVEQNLDLFHRASSLGYFRWPARLREYLNGKSVLDVGCGSGTHSLGCIAYGARSYLGLDPRMKIKVDVTKDKHGNKTSGGHTPKVAFGWSPREISKAISRIQYLRGNFQDIAGGPLLNRFDTIIMLNVTEHLIGIEDVFEGCARHLAPGGVIIFNHDNFYSWNGHHLSPKRPEYYEPSNPEHRLYADWNHLAFVPPPGHYFLRGLNRIRLDDLRALTERYFDIEVWDEKVNDYGRLTPQILKRFPQYSKRELEVANVVCRARARKQG